MSNKNSWEEMSKDIQSRSLGNTPLEVKNAKQFHAQILKSLTSASDTGVLSDRLHEILKLLQLKSSSKIKEKGYFEILGGVRDVKNNNRRQDIPHFKLSNGCWFDFVITINASISPSEINDFSFEIRHPPEISNWFLRFDLNQPSHENDAKNMRFHFHPSNDDIMIHSPPMSPLEILHLFLYGIEIPNKQRSQQKVLGIPPD